MKCPPEEIIGAGNTSWSQRPRRQGDWGRALGSNYLCKLDVHIGQSVGGGAGLSSSDLCALWWHTRGALRDAANEANRKFVPIHFHPFFKTTSTAGLKNSGRNENFLILLKKIHRVVLFRMALVVDHICAEADRASRIRSRPLCVDSTEGPPQRWFGS